MILLYFFLFSLGAALGSFFAGYAVWQAVLVCLGAFVGINLLYVIFWYAVAATVDDTKPIESQKPIYPFGCASIAGWLCAWARVHTTVQGEELLPGEGRFVLVCNHLSKFDPIVTEYKLRKYNLSFISKPSNLKIKGIGKLAYGAGFLPINRENDREALKTILQAVDYLKRGLCSMVIYPEGTRSKTGELGPFHAGSFKIPQRAKVPLVIAAIRNTDQVGRNFPLRSTQVTLAILDVLSPEQVKAWSSTQELAAYAHGRIEEYLRNQEVRG